MDKRIRFGTKEEMNAERERAFLALTPTERLQWFLRSFDERPRIDGGEVAAKANFIIRKRADALR